ncbi:MAG TPA: fumarylacetoacetate hydrolase family protein [Pirellulales bacterium]|nr:fumarylacetoacetate hydrolase family protein [Pirellulales bacterium]
MRLTSYQGPHGSRVAGLRGGQFIDLQEADPELPASMKSLLCLGTAGLERAAAALAKGTPRPLTSVRLLAPVPDPGKIICIGLNYADHARESGVAPPEEPVLFNKFPTALVAHGEPIVLPRVSREVDYEAELVVVIGRGGRHIARERALEHVAGYCPGHDVSARDWQLHKPGKQWLLGKTFDTFAPCGPALVTSDEVPRPGKLRIQFRLNGRTLQDSNTDQLIFPIDELVAYVSQVCTLEPGDLIFTGTPPGVGFARQPPIFLRAGDVAEVEIEGLGVLANPVVAEEA